MEHIIRMDYEQCKVLLERVFRSGMLAQRIADRPDSDRLNVTQLLKQAEREGVKPGTVRQWISAGRLRTYKSGPERTARRLVSMRDFYDCMAAEDMHSAMR